MFDEAELEAALEALDTQLPEDVPATSSSPKRTTRQRGFSASLLLERVELCLSEQEKAGARTTFFSKVKEELAFIPAKLKVIEYWRKKRCLTAMARSLLWPLIARSIRLAKVFTPLLT